MNSATACAIATLTITAKGQVTLRRELLRHLGGRLAGRTAKVASLDEIQEAAAAGSHGTT